MVSVLWLFLVVPCVILQCVIVVFPDHTYLLLEMCKRRVFCSTNERKTSEMNEANREQLHVHVA